MVEAWKNAEPLVVQFGQVTRTDYGGPEAGVYSIFCDDKHVFCGMEGWNGGVVCVYNLNSGEWVRNLVPSEVVANCTQTMLVCGSKEVVAATHIWQRVVSVWSSKGEMEELYSLNVGRCCNTDNHDCIDTTCEHSDKQMVLDMNVVGRKVVVLLQDPIDLRHQKVSVVVFKSGDPGLALFDTF